MHSTERLEILFTLQPATVASTIIVDGKRIAQGTFRDQRYITAWMPTLDGIARATRDLQNAELNLHQGEAAQPTVCISSHVASSAECQTPEHPDGKSMRDAILSASLTRGYRRVTTSLIVDQSSSILAATSGHQSALTCLSAGTTGRVEPAGMSLQWPATTETDEPFTTISTNTSGETEIESANALMSLTSTISAPVRDDWVHSHFFIGPNSSLRDGVYVDMASTPSNSGLSGSTEEAVGSSVSSISSRMLVGIEEQTAGSKRRKKLDLLLERIRDQRNPDQAEHNEKVDNLCNSTISFTSPAPTTAEQFGHLLGDLGHVSDVLGFMYGLLSWEVFRREEDRLIQEEGQSPRWAAKRMNDEMSKQSDRHATTKDWASDGRRAAGMIFGAIAELSPASKSLAIFLLADLAILDNLIKIAHFPVLRERFARVFKEIHTSRDRGDSPLEKRGYRVFDFEEFLRTRGWSINSAERACSESIDPMACQSRFEENESSTSPVHPLDPPLSDIEAPNLNTCVESSRKRRRLSQLSIAGNAQAMWSTSPDTRHHGTDQRTDILCSVAVATDNTNRIDPTTEAEAQHAAFINTYHSTPENTDSPRTQDYNILFGPSDDFDASFHGQKP